MKILVAGDFCPTHRVQENLNHNDYSVLDSVRDVLHQTDYSIVNFECPIVDNDCAKPIVKCGPNLKTNEKSADAIKYAGFDCVTLANNHFRDFSDIGCLTTISELEKRDIDYVGGGANLTGAQQILYRDIQGKKLAIVNFCENEFSIATANSAGAAPMDTVDNYHQITEAREHADYVLVIVHGGHEYYQLPSPRMKKLYRHYIELGADAVVNHHQHCYSGYEFYQGKPIVYGLGNFCFDDPKERDSVWNYGYMVSISFDVTVTIALHPYLQCSSSPTIDMLNQEQKVSFYEKIEALNIIISDDNLLSEAFDDFVETKRRGVMRTFVSYHNRYLNAAAQRSLIPYPLCKREIKAVENFIMCEAHRDVVGKILSSIE